MFQTLCTHLHTAAPFTRGIRNLALALLSIDGFALAKYIRVTLPAKRLDCRTSSHHGVAVVKSFNTDDDYLLLVSSMTFSFVVESENAFDTVFQTRM